MTTRFDKTVSSNHKIDGGYEGNNVTYGYTIPSCGLEDVDKAVFKLFDEQIPLFYKYHDEVKKVPVIFATGERFALLRRNHPITDTTGALILPLISIVRKSIENKPSKGVANNEIFPHVVTKRISKKDLEYRQLNNPEGLTNVPFKNEEVEKNYLLDSKVKNNITETIEIPPIKYFGVSYDVVVWTAFTSQMNNIIETIMSSYTYNQGQQFKIESDKGYWFPAFIDPTLSPDSSYSDFTDAERYIRTTLSLNTTGYLIAPNIEGGKVGLRSFFSAPDISFEVNDTYDDLEPLQRGIKDSSPEMHVYDDLSTEDGYVPASGVGVESKENAEQLLQYDKSKGVAVNSDKTGKNYDRVGEFNSEYTRNKKIAVRKDDGTIVNVKTRQGGKGETLYDQNMAEILFNISTSK